MSNNTKPKGPEWQHFRKGGKKNSSHSWAYCNYCASDDVKCTGTAPAMINHLKKCDKLPTSLKEVYQPSSASASSSAPPLKKQKKSMTQSHFVVREDVPMSDAQFQEFEVKWLFATLDANLSWMWGEYSHIQNLLRCIKPSLRIPSRKRISGPVLDQQNNSCLDACSCS